jgi:DNA-binding response OmpR family regulator
MRILCVEDDADARELMRIFLRQAGYEAVEASDSGDALELAKQNEFALIILDNWLTQGSGVELCKQIRAFDTHTPILFFSGAAYKADVEQAMEAGAQAYLIKPTDYRVVVATVGELIQSARMHSAG